MRPSCKSLRHAAAVAALCSVLATPAAGQQHFAIHQAITHETDAPPGRRADWLDATLTLAWSRAYAAYTFGSFDAGGEVGGTLRDRRGSIYGMTLRRRAGGRVENTSQRSKPSSAGRASCSEAVSSSSGRIIPRATI
jgi:hypothetical protein